MGQRVSLYWPRSLKWVDAIVQGINGGLASIEFDGESATAEVPLDVLGRPVEDWVLKETGNF